MPQNLNVTELDFQQIKENIISYFKNVRGPNGEQPYLDYDFAGSALNTFIDVLAYNTHYNAMLAHMAVNESFIDSAQLRPNVVSAAKLLGYIPRSATASSATINLSFAATQNNNPPNTISLDKNVTFKTIYNDTSYYYVLPNQVSLSLVNGNYISTEPVKIVEGRYVTRQFQVNGTDENEKYVIDDDTVDMSTLQVRVYPNKNDINNVEIYNKFSNIVSATADSKIYFVNENSLGKYEIQFGTGIIGKKLDPLNIIEIEYISTSGAASNGARGPFTIVSFNDIMNTYTTGAKTVTVDSISSGGSDREPIERIRENATYGFITQNRAVTADDYKTLIYTNFQNAGSVSVWGGENNSPPEYGKVFISIRKTATDENPNYTLTAQDRETVLNILSSKKVLSIIPEIVDPEYVDIVLDVLFKYNNNLTTLSTNELENRIRQDVISVYNNSQLNSFDKVFRHSNLVRAVDTYAPAILNSHIRVYVSKTFELNPDTRVPTVIKYGTQCSVDDNRVIAGYATSAPLLYNGQVLALGDEAHPTNSDIRILYTYITTSTGIQKVSSQLATLELSSGTLTLNSLPLLDNTVTLSLDLIPISNDIVSRRNQIISINVQRCNISGYVDDIVVGGSSKSVTYETFTRDRF